MKKTQQTLSIYYDGECPVCSQYVRLYRLKDSGMHVELINLRDNIPKVNEFKTMGFDVDEGMIISFEDKLYHGIEAVHLLALLSTRSGLFNKCNNWIFSHKKLSSILYPIMVAGRNSLLFLLGRKKIVIKDSQDLES